MLLIISRASWEPHTGTCLPPAARSNSNNWDLFVIIDLFTAQRAQPETTAMLTEQREVWRLGLGAGEREACKGKKSKMTLGQRRGVVLRKTVKHLYSEVDQL